MWLVDIANHFSVRFCFHFVSLCLISGGGPFTFTSQQETVVHDLPSDDKDYISVAEEVMTSMQSWIAPVSRWQMVAG